MSCMNVVTKKDNKLQSFVWHGSGVMGWVQERGITNHVPAGEATTMVAPEDSGLLVVDYDKKQIFTMQSYFNLSYTVESTDKGVKRIASRKVTALLKQGWNIVDYMTEAGIAYGLKILWDDLEEIGIEPTDPERWWLYQKKHYLWAITPRSEENYGTNGIKAIIGCTKAQRERLEALNRIDDLCKLSPTYEKSGFSIKFPGKGNEYDKLDRVMRNLGQKGYITQGCSGGTSSGKMDYTFTLLTNEDVNDILPKKKSRKVA